MSGYVKDGKFYRGQPKLEDMLYTSSPLAKEADHEQQRFEHQRDLLQPYDAAGNPNLEFIEAWPTEAKEYGLRGDYDDR